MSYGFGGAGVFWRECPSLQYYPVFKLQSGVWNPFCSRLCGLHQSSYISALKSPVESSSSESTFFLKRLDLFDFLGS